MTKEALKKLNADQFNYCTTLSVLIDNDRKKGLSESFAKDSGKLRGFLECLLQMGNITESEMRSLYLWFFSENRKQN